MSKATAFKPAVSADSLDGLPKRFTSWPSLERAVAHYTSQGGGRVTKASLGGNAMATHSLNLLRALNFVDSDGEPRVVAMRSLANGKHQPVLSALRDHLPQLLLMISSQEDVEQVESHLRALGADAYLLNFVLDTLEREGIAVESYRHIRFTKLATKASPSASRASASVADKSEAQRLTELHKGLEQAVRRRDLASVESYNSMIGDLEDKIRSRESRS